MSLPLAGDRELEATFVREFLVLVVISLHVFVLVVTRLHLFVQAQFQLSAWWEQRCT